MARIKGSQKTGGRKKGTPNKFNVSIKEAVLTVFNNIQGEKDLGHFTQWAEANPTEFYRICSKMIPQQVQAEVNHIVTADELPDNELAAIATGSSTGTAEQTDSQKAVH